MVNVSCAIILDGSGRVLVTRRSANMPLPFKWEFPGGKVEPGETPESCLVREIHEELDVEIEVLEQREPNIHNYGTKSIRLIPFTCRIISGEIHLKEHEAYRWLEPGGLSDLDWAEADVPIVKDFLKCLK